MRLPVLGLARWRRFARRRPRAQLPMRLAPSHFPFSWRTSSRRGELGDQRPSHTRRRHRDLAHHLPRRSSLAVKSSPEAVSNCTPRLIRRMMPSSWAISSRAKRLGILDDDGTHAVALDPIQKGREACPVSIGSAPKTAAHRAHRRSRTRPARRSLATAWRSAFLAVLVGADVGRR